MILISFISSHFSSLDPFSSTPAENINCSSNEIDFDPGFGSCEAAVSGQLDVKREAGVTEQAVPVFPVPDSVFPLATNSRWKAENKALLSMRSGKRYPNLEPNAP